MYRTNGESCRSWAVSHLPSSPINLLSDYVSHLTHARMKHRRADADTNRAAFLRVSLSISPLFLVLQDFVSSCHCHYDYHCDYLAASHVAQGSRFLVVEARQTE